MRSSAKPIHDSEKGSSRTLHHRVEHTENMLERYVEDSFAEIVFHVFPLQ